MIMIKKRIKGTYIYIHTHTHTPVWVHTHTRVYTCMCIYPTHSVTLGLEITHHHYLVKTFLIANSLAKILIIY